MSYIYEIYYILNLIGNTKIIYELKLKHFSILQIIVKHYDIQLSFKT